ncbi:MAG: hypothetical protein QOE55_8510 [Acidobacteriaceae bacterium]|nr:hypothetical protein [Acidobacteriaceae bacterium]
MSPVNESCVNGVVKDHCNPVNGNRRVSQLFAMTFQYGSYERSCFGGTVLVPYLTYFGTVHGRGNSETMKLHGRFRSDELQNLKRESLQARLKIQSCVVNLRERFICLSAQILDTADEQPALPTEFAVNRTLRTDGPGSEPAAGQNPAPARRAAMS